MSRYDKLNELGCWTHDWTGMRCAWLWILQHISQGYYHESISIPDWNPLASCDSWLEMGDFGNILTFAGTGGVLAGFLWEEWRERETRKERQGKRIDGYPAFLYLTWLMLTAGEKLLPSETLSGDFHELPGLASYQSCVPTYLWGTSSKIPSFLLGNRKTLQIAIKKFQRFTVKRVLTFFSIILTAKIPHIQS